MEMLLKLTPASAIQQHVLPMLYRGLDSDSPQIQEMCLSIMPTFANLLDNTNVKNCLLPRIKTLCSTTSSLSVRVNCLVCVGRLLEHLDKWLVYDEVLPFLPQIPSREPAVIMGIIGIYKLAMNHKKLGISKEVISTRILPFLFPLCIENGLNLSQFNSLVALVKQMFQVVETEHRRKLEQLNTLQEEQKAMESIMPIVMPTSKSMEFDKAFANMTMSSATNVDSMTLEDKQCLAKKQETFKNFQNQSEIEPMPIPPPKRETQPTDLSSTLINKNLTSLRQAQYKPMNVTNTNFNLNANFAQNITPATNHMQWPQNNQIYNNQWHSSQTTNKNSNNANWSGLDNLFPQSNNKVPMNQMLSPTLATTGNSNNTTNSLSNSDILDLLS